MGLTKVISGVTAFLTTGVVGTGVSYFSSKATIGDMLKDIVIPVDVEYSDNIGQNAWNKAYAKITDKSKFSKKDIENIEQLESWCKNQYKVFYKDLFTQGNEEILKEVEELCTVSVEDVVSYGENKTTYLISDDWDRQKIWISIKKLLNENVISYSLEFSNLLKEIIKDKEIVNENSTRNSDFKEVSWSSKYSDFCKKILNKNFLGKRDKFYMEADKYCTTP